MITRKDFAWGAVKVVGILLLWNALEEGLGIIQTASTLLTSDNRALISQASGLLFGAVVKFGIFAAAGIFLLTNGGFLIRLINDGQSDTDDGPNIG